MNRNLKHSLAILAASAALGVAAGILIAPQRGRDSRQSLLRLYRRSPRERPATAIAEPAPAPAQPLVESWPYPHS